MLSHETPKVAELFGTKSENTKGHCRIFTMILISYRNKLRWRISDQHGEVTYTTGVWSGDGNGE